MSNLPVIIIKHNGRLSCTLQRPCSDGLASIPRKLPPFELMSKEHLVLRFDHSVHILLADLGLHQAASRPIFGDMHNLVNCLGLSYFILHFPRPDINRGVQYQWNLKFKLCNWVYCEFCFVDSRFIFPSPRPSVKIVILYVILYLEIYTFCPLYVVFNHKFSEII